jgi:hypothetical protein
MYMCSFYIQHILRRTAKLHIYQSTKCIYRKTLMSATYVFIKNSANGSETVISICNAVNNFPPGRWAALTNDLPLGNEARLSNYCHNLSWPFSKYLGPFFHSYSPRPSVSHSPYHFPGGVRHGGVEQWSWTDGVYGVYYTILSSLHVWAHRSVQYTAVGARGWE